jgi:hypothetical protein
MPIPVITNFSINDTKPLDDRTVATGSESMNGIYFKYPGLTVYRSDLKKNYQWDGTSWNLLGSGIYGGNGGLPNDVYVDMTANSTQRDPNVWDTSEYTDYQHLNFVFSASASGTQRSYLKNYFSNKSGGVDAKSFEYVMAFDTTSSLFSSNFSSIRFNSYDLSNNNNHGGIAISTSNLVNTSNSVRFQVEGNGIIRFRPSASLPSFLNVSSNSTNTAFNFGNNWDGSSKTTSTLASSYIEFKSEEISIFNANAATALPTKTLTISPTQVTSTKNIVVTSFPGSVELTLGGLRQQAVATPSGNSFAVSNFLYLFYKTTTNIDLMRFSSTGIRVEKTMEIGSPFIYATTPVTTGNTTAALFTYGPLYARYYTSMWDQFFVADPEDNDWEFKPLESDNTSDVQDRGMKTEQVRVVKDTISGQTQDCYFVIIPRSYSVLDRSRSVWDLDRKNYDRIVYFHYDHLKGSEAPFFPDLMVSQNLPFQLTWYLTHEPYNSQDEQDGTFRRWKKIGKVETFSIGDYDFEQSGVGVSPFFSQQVLVPAGMSLRFIFNFPYSMISIQGLAAQQTAKFGTEPNFKEYVKRMPIVAVTCIRSGSFKTNIESRTEIEWDTNDSKDFLLNDGNLAQFP